MAHDAKDDGQLQPHWSVVLRGEIDLSRAEDMRTTVDGFSASQHRSIRVDLHHVEFLDSTCVNALIDLTRVARSRGGTMTVEGARPQARRVFDVLGLSHALGIPGTTPVARRRSDMAYLAPTGWTERLDDPSNSLTAIRPRFHVRHDCPMIRHPESLTRSERPGTAARCRTCAPE